MNVSEMKKPKNSGRLINASQMAVTKREVHQLSKVHKATSNIKITPPLRELSKDNQNIDTIKHNS